MGKTNRYCHYCGSRMRYIADCSTPKARNEDRILTYECNNCYEITGKIELQSVRRTEFKAKDGQTVYSTTRINVIKGDMP